jgi:hypothetical protein
MCNRSDTVYAFVGSNMMCFITFALQSAPMSKGSDTSFVAAFTTQRVGLGIGYNQLEVKDAKNKACT